LRRFAARFGGVGEKFLEVVAGGVVEGETRHTTELRVQVLESLAAQLRLALQDSLFRVGQHAVQAAEHGQRQDHILVLAALEGVADEIRDTPEETDDFTVVHGYTL